MIGSYDQMTNSQVINIDFKLQFFYLNTVFLGGCTSTKKFFWRAVQKVHSTLD